MKKTSLELSSRSGASTATITLGANSTRSLHSDHPSEVGINEP